MAPCGLDSSIFHYENIYSTIILFTHDPLNILHVDFSNVHSTNVNCGNNYKVIQPIQLIFLMNFADVNFLAGRANKMVAF